MLEVCARVKTQPFFIIGFFVILASKLPVDNFFATKAGSSFIAQKVVKVEEGRNASSTQKSERSQLLNPKGRKVEGGGITSLKFA